MFIKGHRRSKTDEPHTRSQFLTDFRKMFVNIIFGFRDSAKTDEFS